MVTFPYTQDRNNQPPHEHLQFNILQAFPIHILNTEFIPVPKSAQIFYIHSFHHSNLPTKKLKPKSRASFILDFFFISTTNDQWSQNLAYSVYMSKLYHPLIPLSQPYLRLPSVLAWMVLLPVYLPF